jgi:hypothetical protein
MRTGAMDSSSDRSRAVLYDERTAMTTNAIDLPTIARRIRTAWDRTQASHDAWVEATLELMEALSDGRRAFPADREFSIWLAEQELDFIGHQDRAALLQMAQHRDLTRAKLEETERISYQLIWKNDIAPRITNVSKADATLPPIAEPTESPAETPISARTPVPPSPPAVEEPEVSIPGSFAGRPRAQELAAIYTHHITRKVLVPLLGRRIGGKDVWDLMLWSVDHGFLTGYKVSVKEPSLRLLFPMASFKYAARYNLEKAEDRRQIRERICPAALAHREEILAHPEDFAKIVHDHWAQAERTVADQRKATKLAEAIKVLPHSEQEVVIFGQYMWPKNGQGRDYTYAQLCAASWAIRDWLTWIRPDESPKSKAIIIRLMIRWFADYLNQREPHGDIRTIFTLMQQITFYFEQQPDAECRYAISPKGTE